MRQALPCGWIWATLGDLGNWASGGTPSRSHPEYYGGDIPWVKTGDLTDGPLRAVPESITESGLQNSAAKRFPVGTLLVAMYGATIGKLGILEMEAATNQACAALVPTNGTGKFIPYSFQYLLSQRDELKRIGQGGAQPNISQGILKSYPIPIPPISEQHRIVVRLDVLRARSRRAREALDEVPALLEKLRQSILAAAFRGDLTKDWRAKNPDVEPAEKLLQRIRAERRKKWEEAELAKLKSKGKPPTDDRWKAKYQEPVPVVPTGLPDLPETWCWASVEELSTKVVDGVHQKPNYVNHGVPFLTVKNLTAGPGISFANTSFITEEDHAEFIRRADPERGDILISKDGTLGVPRLVTTQERFSIFVSLALVKPVVRTMGEYLEFAFLSPFFQKRFKATGSGLLHIHLVDLRAAALPLAPEAEQRHIVGAAAACLTRINLVRRGQDDAGAALNALSAAILAKAFRGELVPQDPSDEPAAAMLARLQSSASSPGSAPGSPPAPRKTRGRPRKS